MPFLRPSPRRKNPPAVAGLHERTLAALSALLRFLDMIRRDLGALDARAEIGGNEPSDPRLLFALHPAGFRVVVVFAEPPADPSGARARLSELCETFRGVGSGLDVIETRIDVSIARRLDAELATLAERVGAARAFVVDRESPVLWGTSGKRKLEDGVDVLGRRVDVLRRARDKGLDAEALARIEAKSAERELLERGLDPWSARFFAREIDRCGDASELRRELAAALALDRLRERWDADPLSRVLLAGREGELGFVARSFAGIYALVLAFDGTYSELHAEALLLRALPLIERLVLSLPPIEPPEKPAKVVRLPKRRR